MPNGTPAPPEPEPAITAEEPAAERWEGDEAPASLTQVVLDWLAILPSLF